MFRDQLYLAAATFCQALSHNMKSFNVSLVATLGLTSCALAQNSSSTATSYPPSATGTSSSPDTVYTITAENITAKFIPHGARLTSVLIPDRDGAQTDVVVGYDNGTQYLIDSQTNHTYFGAVVGRYANRIKNGTFTLNGQTYHIPTNENGGLDTLHGGTVGYDQRNWTVIAYNDSSVSFQLLDVGLEGFPGSVLTTAVYTVSSYPSGPQGQMRPRLTTKLVSVALDQETPIMLSNHIYWNLNAFKAQTVLNDTSVWMPYSQRYIEIDTIEVPTGAIGVVSNEPSLDFLAPKTLGEAVDNSTGVCGYNCTGVDNAFILDRPYYSSPEGANFPVMSVWSAITGIQMDISTNQQGMQLYTCNGQNGTIPIKQSQIDANNGVQGAAQYVNKYGCYAIEPQAWIDGINNPQWGVNKYEIYGPESGPAVNYATYDFSTY